MNNQNRLSAEIDSSQTQEVKSNHESNTEASQFQSLLAEMKARIVKLIQHILFDFMKAQQQVSSILLELSATLHQRSHEDRSMSRSSSYDQASSIK